MEKKLYYAAVEHPRCGDDLEHPWKYAVAPYRAAPHVWQVGGQDDVGPGQVEIVLEGPAQGRQERQRSAAEEDRRF